MKTTLIHRISTRAVLASAVIAALLGARPSVAQTFSQPFRPDEINQAGALSKTIPTPTPVTASATATDSASPVATPGSVFMQPEVRAALPVAPATAMQTTDSEYVLTPNDSIEMSIFRESDLTTRATISRDGTVQFPLINDVKVAGLTIKQARNLIRDRYNADYLVEPQVSLGVTKFAERKFTIIGQVNNPGTYTLNSGEGINLIEAIGMAGGFTRIADKRNVMVKRGSGGTAQTFKINAKKMVDSSAAPMEIVAGDVISVGESWY
ncbi:MAG TPA: polysaccharide biosynthesis/export family protein [Chthoniobacterales bacterium]|jgi:polysaccharide export outer membrane protein